MNYQNERDENLVVLSLAGDDAAYEELVIRYQKAVIAAAYNVSKCHHLAEDAAQDAFVSAWIKLNMLREHGKFGAWVCRIAQNCARNNLHRFHEYVGLDAVEGRNDFSETVEETIIKIDEKERLHRSVERLPGKISTVIKMFYFEGLSIAEIAEKMSTPVGTVKYQLHTGRKLIRKDYGDMCDMVDATLVERVMKQVFELKLWRLKHNKIGFTEEYNRVLAEVERLPETVDKNSALADVLREGYWWLPGDENDAMLERLNEVAVAGRNEDVLCFLLDKECVKLPSAEHLDFIVQKQIPRMAKLGFKQAEGYLWFNAGYLYLKTADYEKGVDAFEKAKKLLEPSNIQRLSIEPQLWLYKTFPDVSQSAFFVNEIRNIDGKLINFVDSADQECRKMGLYTNFDHIFDNIWRRDNLLYDSNLKVGEISIGSDNHSKREFVADDETVETLCGTFENCEHWYLSNRDGEARDDKHIWYKDGVGIVRIEQYNSGYYLKTSLKGYSVKGNGILPMEAGNKWIYTRENFKGEYENVMEVTYKDDVKAVFVQRHRIVEPPYDENDWSDMMKAMRVEYFDRYNFKLVDVTHYIERAEALASSPYEKTYTRFAASTMRRILSTDSSICKDSEYFNRWNFFEYKPISIDSKGVEAFHGFDRSFELKAPTAETYPLLQNDIFGIIKDNTGYIWKNEWAIEGDCYEEVFNWSLVKTHIRTEYCGDIATKAGKFENCLRVSLDSEGLDGGLAYRGGKGRDYYFAKGIGIVRTVVPFENGEKQAIYDLAEYSGVDGTTFFPIDEGFTRRYELVCDTKELIGGAHYACEKDDHGRLIVFADRTGIEKRKT